MPDNFTLIPAGAAIDASTINIPLQELDNAIGKKNLNATTNPTANDDTLDGYDVGSIWVNATLGRVFFALDVTAAAAVWSEVTGRQNNLTALVAPTVNDDEDDGYSVASLWVDAAAERAYIAIDVTAGAAVWQGISYPTNVFQVTSGNLVVLGHTAALSMHGGISQRLQAHANSNAAGFSAARFSANAFPAQISLAKSRSGTVGTHTVVVPGDSLGKLTWEGSDGTDFEVGAEIEVISEATPGNNDMPAGMAFRTTPDGSTSPVQRMYINNAGRIGIGQNPDAAAILGVAGNVKITGDLEVAVGLTVQYTASIASDLQVDGASFLDGTVAINHKLLLGQAPTDTFMTDGIVIDIASNNDDALELQSSGTVNHGASAVADTQTFGAHAKVNGANGGYKITGLTTGNNAFMVDAVATTEDDTHNAGAVGYIILRARKVNGTGATTPTAGRNTVVFAAGAGNATHIFNSNGESWEDGTGWTQYDDWDDYALLELANTAFTMSRTALQEDFWRWAQEHALILQHLNLIQFNEDGHHFINRSRMQDLFVGWARQAMPELIALRARVAALEARA